MEINRPILIFLLISIGLISLPHADNLPLPIFGYFCLLWCWRFVGIWKNKWLPNTAALLLLTIVGVGLLYTQHRGILGRDAGTALFLTALGLKLLEIKSSREIYLINYLAFIVAASLFLFQQSILMSLYTLFVCCMLLVTLVAINSRQFQTIAALKTAVSIIAQALPLAIIIFILFPRIEAPRWMMFEDKHRARTGLSDTLEPGTISQLGLSDELAFRVKFHGEIPPPAQRYWRGPVFSQTDGKRWQESPNRSFEDVMDRIRFSGKAYRYTLMMEPQNQKWVYALDMPADYDKKLKRNSFYQLITSKDPEERMEYHVLSYPRYNTGYLTRTEYNDNMQLPDQPSTRIKTLVERLKGFDGEPEKFIERLLNHFRTENFHYTLTPDLMEESPIETFLFENRRGFCSHYATAFVYLMRTAGIPARVVSGYQGGEFNQVGGFLEVRQADAHAWTEVWLKEKGWIRVDPTAAIAPERVENSVDIDRQIATGEVNFTAFNTSGAMSWLKRGHQLWNSIDYNWQRWVINYNNASQSKFLSSLGIDNLKSLALWLIGGITLVSALLAWLILRNKPSAADPSLKLYQQFCRKIAQQGGLIIEIGEGPQHFALRVKQDLPQAAEQIDRITTLLIKLRYQPGADAQDLRELKQLISRFKISNS